MSDERRHPIAIVTGAGSGIGREVSQALAREGYHVALAGRGIAALEETAAGAAGKTAVIQTDVAEEMSVRSLFAAVLERFGRVDVLFNNAGTFGPTEAVERYSLKAWTTVLDTNLTGAFLCAREAFRVMSVQDPGGGRIINNGSISAHTPRPNAVAYTASKHAMTGLTKALALEGRGRGIACGQIDIGNAATAMTHGLDGSAADASRPGAPEPTFDVSQVGRAIVYMAGLPLDANVPFMTVMATEMPFMGRG